MTGSEHTQVGHWMRDDCDVYAGRGRNGARFGSVEIGERGWLGNPYRADEYGREECIEKFRTVFERCLSDDEEFREAIRDLAGKRLGCWCQRLDEDEPACHAEVIAEHADRLASIRADGGEPQETGVEQEDLLEFVDTDEYAEDLYDHLLKDRFAVVQVRDYPPGEEPVNWFVRQVQDRGAEEAPTPEFISYNPMNGAFSATDEEGMRKFLNVVEEARIVSLRVAPWWGNGSAYEEVKGRRAGDLHD